MQLEELLKVMWEDYIQLNPNAERIHRALAERGETVFNDHIALRTFNAKGWGVDTLSKAFEKLGYAPKGDYQFENKKLVAKHFEHENKDFPKVFVSELELEKFSSELQDIIASLLSQVPSSFLKREDLCCAGRPWDLEYADYEQLSKESEYASWVAAHGFRPNHFTVNVNKLTTFGSLKDLNEFIKGLGLSLNVSGGEIKGGPEDKLEQSSTMAPNVDVKFKGNIHKIPGCYYEFAKRYTLDSGELYQGFVAASADKIFESTQRKF